MSPEAVPQPTAVERPSHDWNDTVDVRPLHTLARNVSTRYLAVFLELLLGIVMLPFNLHHLGQEAYGLWILTASVTMHLSILDLGFGGGLLNFVARYRAQRDSRALNEIASTLFVVFSTFSVLAYLIIIVVALNITHVFKLTPGQAETARWILLIIGSNVAANFIFSIYGGVIDGFQRYDINNVVASVTSVTVALVNVTVLTAGFGLIQLVIATTTVRMIAYFVYRRNAYHVFPALRIRLTSFRRERLREVTGFSIYAGVIDWANRLNYELDEFVIGMFIGPAAVAVWAVADRVISGAQRLTNQSNTVLFPVVVDSDATNRIERLRKVLIEGTRLSLASVVPIAVTIFMLSDQLVSVWVGPRMFASASVMRILALAVMLRVGTATSTTLLKGAGRIRYVASVNIVTGLANLVMSIALIRPFGIDGVAWGTLIPIAFSSVFLLWPASCARVGIPLSQSVRRAVWPTVWPGILAAACLAVTRGVFPVTFLAVAIQAAIAGVVYLAAFGVALGRADRALYGSKLMELIGARGYAPAA